MDCVAGLFSGLWCIAVIQEQASPIYLRQHKSAQPSTANVVESIAPPISSHIPTACSCCVPGKGGARGGKAGFATLSAFPLVPAHAKMVPLKGKVPASQASPGKGITCVSSIPPGKGITCVSSIPPERENILRKAIRLRFHRGTAGSELPGDKNPPEVHQTLRKYSDRKLPYRFLYKAPARSVPDTM